MEMNAIGHCPSAGAVASHGPGLVTSSKVAEGAPSGRTPLMKAAESGDVESVRSLLNSAVEVNAVDQHGKTALMMAAAMGHVEAVRVLIANGVKLDATTPYGWTALRFAEEWGHGEIARLLETSSPAVEGVPTVDSRDADLD